MSMPPSPFKEPAVKPTLEKLVRAWEKLRDLNTGGYGSGVVAQIANDGWLAPNGTGKTSCSPFTGTVMGMIFSEGDGAPYKPVFNGSEPLPGEFYTLQNGDLPRDRSILTGNGVKDLKQWRLDNTLQDSAGAPCWFNLAEPIGYCWWNPDNGKTGREGHPEKMRRGDLLKIEWWSKPLKDKKTGQDLRDKKGNLVHICSGHATFCWDVHLDKDGNVDAFQYISSNGTHEKGGVGVSVCGSGPGIFVNWDKVSNKYFKTRRANFTDILDGKDYPEYAEGCEWYAMPDLTSESFDSARSTFRKTNPNKHISIMFRDTDFIYAREIKVARLRGIQPPDPYPQPDGKDDKGTKHFVVTPTVKQEPKKGEEPKKADQPKKADEPKKAEEPKKPVKQIDDAPTEFQHAVEAHLQILFRAKWITSDPGDATSVNDASSQAALKEFQEKYTKHEPNGVPDKDTRKRLGFFAPYALRQLEIEMQLRVLKDSGKIESDPGTPDAERDEKSTAALVEFQKQKGLDPDGIPGPNTCSALDRAVAELNQPKEAPPQKPLGCPNENEVRKKIVEAAKAEVGMTCDHEYKDPNGRIPAFFQTAFGMKGQKGAYCAAFAAYCWKTAGVQYPFVKGDAWVPSLYQHFKKIGRIIPPGGEAKPGDLVFVQSRGGGESDKKNNTWPCHVGLVYEIKGTKLLKTIEGNWNRGPGSPSGVYIVEPANYYADRICGYGSLVGLSDAPAQNDAPAKQDAPAKKEAPAKTDSPAPQPQEAVPPKPALLWGCSYAVGGEQVDLRLHVANIGEKADQLLVMLTDADGKQTAAHMTSGASRTVPHYMQLFIEAPHAPDGSRFKASLSAPLQDGSRVSVATEDELVIGEHQCDDCKAIQAIGDDAAFAGKIRVGSTATNEIKAVQRMLVKFGYDLGKSKAFPDGVDGSYGEIGAHALRYFLREASGDDPVFQRMSPLYPDKDARMVELFVSECARGFKRSWPRPAAPPSKKPFDPQLPEVRPLPPITSGAIRVAGKDFVDWFNQDFQPKRKTKLGITDANGNDTTFFENKINGANFRKVFDQISSLSGKEETPLAEFVAFFCVFYNEEGGTFEPKAEAHAKDELWNFRYLFKEVQGGKVSYNRPNNKQKLAGDQLFARGAISASERDAWNKPSPFPEERYRPALGKPLRECDFYRFQGRGLTQITWREAYEKYVVPALKEAGGYETDLDKISSDQLERAFQDPKVYLRAVYHEWHAGQVGRALPDVNNDPPEFFWVGYHIGGRGDYGRIYHLRSMELFRSMIAGNYSCG